MYMYITKTIMKFRLLDTTTTHHAHHTQHMHQLYKARDTYTDTYQYLDDLLDKTYLTDYFMDKSAGVGDTAISDSHASNK